VAKFLILKNFAIWKSKIRQIRKARKKTPEDRKQATRPQSDRPALRGASAQTGRTGCACMGQLCADSGSPEWIAAGPLTPGCVPKNVSRNAIVREGYGLYRLRKNSIGGGYGLQPVR
jgi:hypothetical protein